ncbi:uncharacterized protein LTR77_002589 [Saxophila tyrrhenica]|uniref:Uncharacterized protein n=1 Tax=Saxophila tyrrhenica TaxID=1690608 RepID=A0AAV9PMI7_9PEZI|nr:hypothetical protein LTR77_002589 [Saxophila tyrrhenica]
MTSSSLTEAQCAALLDVLIHDETYAEIEDFKTPGVIKQYGPPFQDSTSTSRTPVLQTLVSKFILTLPGLRDVSHDFWRVRVKDLIEELSQAELSESYDKGVLGIRKTLATAISALIEYPARGSLFGLPKRDEELQKAEKGGYDISKPEDVLRSWQDCLQALVYGNLVDELFSRAAETDDLKKHGGLVQGMHEFVVVNIASLMHYTLVLSPEGPTLLRMIENVHRLIPYVVVRQTLKIGNVATMISAMMRVILAKVSVASVTNWIGLSSGADEGMNLLQQIMSQVLSWDKRDLNSRATKIEKASNGPPKPVIAALKDWIATRSRAEHEEARRQSRDGNMSIIAVILSLSSCPSADDITEAQHAATLEYLKLRLSIRDRDEIVRVLCHRNPDHLTAMIQDAVAAYTPMIRQVHEAVNLADTVWDFERFTTDMLKMSKPSGPKGQEKPPTVEDYVDLLHRHQNSSHKFLHQVAKNGKEVTGWWRDWVNMVIKQFRRQQDKPPETSAVVDQKMSGTNPRERVQKSFANLSEADQSKVKKELDAYKRYLDDLHTASATRITAVINRTRSTPFGPGAYLARWQNLLDATAITPGTAKGPVRKGANKGVREEGRKDIEGNEAGFVTEEEVEKAVDRTTSDAPSVEETVRLLGPRFRELLAGG